MLHFVRIIFAGLISRCFSILRFMRRFLRLFYIVQVRYSAARAGKGLFVGFPSRVTNNTFLGDNVNFNGMHISGNGKVTIGNNFHSGEDNWIFTAYHNYEGDKIPYDETFMVKDVTIEDNVWLGHRVIILGGATIGEGAIIQAGSVVVSDISKYAIAGGHPARVFKYRNIEHYLRLKEAGKFH